MGGTSAVLETTLRLVLIGIGGLMSLRILPTRVVHGSPTGSAKLSRVCQANHSVAGRFGQASVIKNPWVVYSGARLQDPLIGLQPTVNPAALPSARARGQRQSWVPGSSARTSQIACEGHDGARRDRRAAGARGDRRTELEDRRACERETGPGDRHAGAARFGAAVGGRVWSP